MGVAGTVVCVTSHYPPGGGAGGEPVLWNAESARIIDFAIDFVIGFVIDFMMKIDLGIDFFC